ncbi:unnamed protein product [Heterobilharzia americana]|nr:unnamed protein product [Heterobilharzia americana]
MPFPTSHSPTVASNQSHQNLIPSLLRPCHRFREAALNFRTLCQTRQQASLTITLEFQAMHIRYVFPINMHDPSVVVKLTSPVHSSESSKFTLGVYGDLVASSRGVVGVHRMAISAFLVKISVNSRLFVVRPNMERTTQEEN